MLAQWRRLRKRRDPRARATQVLQIPRKSGEAMKMLDSAAVFWPKQGLGSVTGVFAQLARITPKRLRNNIAR